MHPIYVYIREATQTQAKYQIITLPESCRHSNLPVHSLTRPRASSSDHLNELSLEEKEEYDPRNRLVRVEEGPLVKRGERDGEKAD